MMSKGMSYIAGSLIGIAIGEVYGLYILGPMMESLEASLAIGLAIGIGLGNAIGMYLRHNR